MEGMVFIVDDDAAVRQCIENLLRYAGYQVQAFASAQDFLRHDAYEGPACLVLDVCLPGLNGLELQRRLAQGDYPLPIIFISGQSDIPTSVKAMKAGAVDFLPKPVEPDNLLSVVRQAMARCRQALLQHAKTMAVKERLNRLTTREREVFEHLLTGQLNKQIAADLNISETTVKIHRRRVLQKMEVQSLVELSQLVEQASDLAVKPEPATPAYPISLSQQSSRRA